MRRTLPLALAATLAIGNFAFTTDAGGDRVYFECTSSSPNTNLEGAVGTWSETAPESAMGSGNGGCFALDTSLDGAEPGNSSYDVVWEGTYEGAIKDLVIHMFVGSTGVGHQADGADVLAEMTLVVDGAVVYQTDIDSDRFFSLSKTGDGPFPFTTQVEGTLEGLKVKKGTHTIQLTMTTPYLNVPTFWMYGASDAASGITFNPKDSVGTITQA